MFARLADRFILKPTKYPIAAEGRTRRLIEFGSGHVEVWVQRTSPKVATANNVDDVQLFVLKFVGTAGRAERASEHPADYWSTCCTEVWAVNPPGYGGSSGQASLQLMAPAARAVFSELMQVADGRPIFVAGNSLGTAYALHVAAHLQVNGLLLRNPPPLRELIVGRHSWWNFGLGSKLIARQVPTELCCVRNAAATDAPAVFVTSGKDRLVPPRFQRLVLEAYAGEKRILRLPQADHASPLEEDEQPQYADMLSWLKERAISRDVS